jgi:hypothetical protein
MMYGYNYIEMAKILVLVLLLAISFCQPDYQERCLYYDESDNVCAYGEYSDLVDLVFSFDDRPIKEIAV